PPFQKTAQTATPLDPFNSFSHPQQFAFLPPLTKDFADSVGNEGASTEGRRLQIGLYRPFDRPVTVNQQTMRRDQWSSLSNGWQVASFRVASPGAVGMRVHFENVSLLTDARFV